MRFNINNLVKVRLTYHGHHILRDYYSELSKSSGSDLSSLIPKIDKDGYQSFQLWNFMQIFGSEMWNGARQIIVNNEIII